MGAALGAFALLIQVWLPWLHHPPVLQTVDVQTADAQTADQASYARAAAFFGGDLALCQSEGVGTQDHSDLPGKTPSHKPFSCPICRALHMLGNFVPPAGPDIVAGPPPAAVGDAIGQAPIIARVLDPTSQPRAPPMMA